MGLHEGPYWGWKLRNMLQRATVEPVSHRLQNIVWAAVIVTVIGAVVIAFVVKV